MILGADLRDDTVIIIVEGSVDASNADLITEFASPHIQNESCTHLIVDMSGVDFMSSAGIRAILAMLKLGREHNTQISLAAMQAGVRKTCLMGGIDKIVTLYPTVDEAVAAL